MADERKYAIIDTLDKGDDVLNGLKNSQESITLMTTRNLGLVLSGEIAVDDELKTKFSDLSTKLHTGGSVETKINTIVTDITTKLASVGTPGSIDHQIKDLKDKNEKLNIDITYLNSVRGGGVLTDPDSIRLFGVDWATFSGLPINERRGRIDSKKAEFSSNISRNLADINSLASEKTTLATNETPRKNIQTKYRQRRDIEIEEWSNGINSFETTTSTISDINIDFTNRAASINPIADGDLAFNRTHTTAVDPNFKYEICDKTGRALTKEGNTYIYSVDSTTVKLKNIKFDRVTGTFDFTDLETEPLIDRNELELSITAKKENINGLNFVLNKPLKINLLHYNQLAKPAGREPVLEDVNNQPGNVLKTKLDNTYTTYREDYEKEMLLKVCKKAFLDANGSEAKWKELFPTSDHENELYTRLRKEYTTTTRQGFADTLDDPDHFTDFDTGFKPRYADDKREWNKKPENIKDATAYKNYLMSTYPTEIANYMKEKFEKIFNERRAHNFITAKFLEFKDEQEKRGRDNNSHLHLDTSLPAEPKKHRDNYLLGMIPASKARSYVSLFTGAETSIKDEKLSLRDLDNKPESILYDMDLKILSANKMVVKITKKDPNTGKEIAVMEQSGGNPIRLIRNVIRNLTKLKGKERLHIAYNIMRSLTEIAKSKKIPLSYVVGNDTRTLSVADDGNILLESNTVNTTTHRSTPLKIFDYNQHFASTQNRDCGGQSLESGIVDVMKHFDKAMEHTYQNYRDVVSNKLFGTPDKLNTKINARRYQPFKLLNNLRNKRNFSYDIPLTQVGDAQVAISFKENNDFEITLQRYGKTYMFRGANLKKILKAKRGGKRVFEGIGNEVLALIHHQHFSALRGNTKMIQEDQLFAAKDPHTGRRYFMDEEGRLSYVEHYNTAAINAFNNEVTTAANRKKGRQIAGAAGATAGAGVLGAGAYGAATAVKGASGRLAKTGMVAASAGKGAGAGLLGGAASHKRFTKIFHKNEENYGVIHKSDNLDEGRTYCSPEEQEKILHSNPVLVGRLRKAMKNRMGIFESSRAAIAKLRA